MRNPSKMFRWSMLAIFFFSIAVTLQDATLLWLARADVEKGIWTTVLLPDISVGLTVLGILFLEFIVWAHWMERVSSPRRWVIEIRFFYFGSALSIELVRYAATHKTRVRREVERHIKLGHARRDIVPDIRRVVRLGHLEKIEKWIRLFQEVEELERQRADMDRELDSLDGEEARSLRKKLVQNEARLAKLHGTMPKADENNDWREAEADRLERLARESELGPSEKEEIVQAITELRNHWGKPHEFRKKAYELERRLAPQLQASESRAGASVHETSSRIRVSESPKVVPATVEEDDLDLPLFFRWPDGRMGQMLYEDSFYRARDDLGRAQQKQLTKMLRFISQDPEYSSLETRAYVQPVPSTPYPCFVSRVNYRLRFSWTQYDDLVVYMVFPKNWMQ